MKIIEAKQSLLYAIKGGALYKVGFTANLPARLAHLQGGSPVALTVAFFAATTAKAAPKAEHAAHMALDEFCDHDEWFRAPLDITRSAILAAIATTEARLYPGINWFPHGRPRYDSPVLA
jgi:hypothetical protein